MNVHAHILANPENITVAEDLLKRGAGYVPLVSGGIRHGEITRAIELLYMKLNSFFLEWNYRKIYGNMEELHKTFDHAMRGFATNPDPNFKPILDHFRDIFNDFPDEFMDEVYGRLIHLRDTDVKVDRKIAQPPPQGQAQN